MESPKFIICPECNERYNDTTKRRLIDSCGHPRCYSCLFKDNPCPVCSKLLHRRERARTLSVEKLLDNNVGVERPSYERNLSDTASYTGRFRKDSYLRTLYSYDTGSKDMEDKLRKYKSLELLSDRTRNGSSSSDFSSDVFVPSPRNTPEQRSLSSSIDELDHTQPKSPATPETPDQPEPMTKTCPKAWPSCPDLSLQENVWQMRTNIERRKRPSSLYQMKYSSNSSPRGSMYSPRSSGYWSELEQLSESESFPTPKQPSEVQSPLSKNPEDPTRDLITAYTHESTKSDRDGIKENLEGTPTLLENPQDLTQNFTTARTPESKSGDEGIKEHPEQAQVKLVNKNTEDLQASGNHTTPSLQKPKAKCVIQQRRFQPNCTRSTECLRYVGRENDGQRLQKPFQRVNSIEYHTVKVSENNVQRKAYMTDV